LVARPARASRLMTCSQTLSEHIVNHHETKFGPFPIIKRQASATMPAGHRRRMLPSIVIGSVLLRNALGWVSSNDFVFIRTAAHMRLNNKAMHSRRFSVLQQPLLTAKPPKRRDDALWSTNTVENAVEETTTLTPDVQEGSTAGPDAYSDAPSLARSFVPSRFDPLLTGGHLQSILGFFLRESCGYVPRGDYAALMRQAWEGAARAKSRAVNNAGESGWFWDVRERIDTPDGDWFHADTKFCDSDNNGKRDDDVPTVLLLHGLCSSSNSSLAMDVATSVTQRGMNCVCLNFRGCSGTVNAKLGGYHLGFTDDLKHYLELRHNCQQKHPSAETPVYLVGYSLGANVVLKCLGELHDDASAKYNIGGAVALCAPLDQTKNAPVLAQPGMQQIYTRNLLNALQPMVQEQLQQFCNSDVHTSRFDYFGAVNAKTITEFDEAFIAPVYGFRDANDYYHRTSSVRFLDRIRVPTLVLNAEDDPFLDSSVWPVREHCCTLNPESYVRFVQTEHGGHLGFCFHQDDGDNDQLNGDSPNADDGASPRRRPSWVAREAGRFLNHVHSWASPP
jgi:uncharacterized protein